MSAIGQKPPQISSFASKVGNLFKRRDGGVSFSGPSCAPVPGNDHGQDAFGGNGQRHSSQEQQMSKGHKDMADALGANLKRRNAVSSRDGRPSIHRNQLSTSSTVSSSSSKQVDHPRGPNGRIDERWADRRESGITLADLHEQSPLQRLQNALHDRTRAAAGSQGPHTPSEDDMNFWSKM